MAFVDDVGVVANAECLAHVVVGDEHADAAIFQKRDDALDLDHSDGVDAGEGLVQQDETRLGCQGAGNLYTPALAARQRQRAGFTQVLDTQFLQQTRQAFFNFVVVQRLASFRALGETLQLQHRAHVLFDIQFSENRRFLRQVTQPQPGAPVNRHVFDRFAVNFDIPRAGAHQADDHVKRGRFPRAIGPQQTNNFALFDRQGNVFHHFAAAVVLLQVAGLQAAFTVAVRNRLDWM